MMIPIILSSILALGIIIDRCYTFFVECKRPRPGTLNRLLQLVDEGKTTEAETELQTMTPAVAGFYRAIIGEPLPNEREQVAEKAGDNLLFQLNRRLSILGAVGSVAPLMGLLGTVLGMIRVFSRVAQAGNAADISILAGGIWEALITTAAGMAVAIPVLIIHHFFIRHLQETAHAMQQAGDQLITCLKKREAIS